MSKNWSDMLDERFGPVGSPERIAFDAECARMRERDARLDRIFGWMKRIPPRLPARLDEDGWDWNRWNGLGPLMFLFWRTLADERFSGTLDMLSFHYFDDKYVLSFRDIRKMRRTLGHVRHQEHQAVDCWCNRQAIAHHDCRIVHPDLSCPYTPKET